VLLLKLNAVQTKYDIRRGAIAALKHPMSPKDKQHTLGMIFEKVSLAVLAVLGAVGLAFVTATALGVLPIVSAS